MGGVITQAPSPPHRASNLPMWALAHVPRQPYSTHTTLDK